MEKLWEIGSEFHWSDGMITSSALPNFLPKAYELFATGRSVLRWSSETVPFNSILVCKNHEIREALRKFLISQNIFPIVHWQQPLYGQSSDDSIAIDLSNRIITIPTDHRYSGNDITQIVDKISEFSRKEYIQLVGKN